MARKVFTVTHPDGTVSKRTSASANYAFAVVITDDAEALAVRQDDMAAQAQAQAEAMLAAAATGIETRAESPWPFGGRWVEVHLGGIHATGGVENPDKGVAAPTEDEAREALRVRAGQHRKAALWHEARAAELRAGAPVLYRVARWSRTHALASQAARSAFPGWSTSVVEVDRA